MRKGILVAALVIGLLLMSGAGLSAANQLKLIVNGAQVPSDVAPQIVGDRVMVPARVLAEALGAKVDWHAEEQELLITAPDPIRQWDALINDADGSQAFRTQAVHHVSDRYLLVEQGSDCSPGERYFWLWDKELKQKSLLAAQYAHLDSTTAQQVVFTVKGGAASGSLSFPYRYILDLATGITRSEPLYLAQDVALGSGAAWPHNLDAIEVRDNNVHIAFSVPEDFYQVGGNRTPLTTVDYAGDELTLRIYGIRSKEPTIQQPSGDSLISKIEYSWLPEGQPQADLSVLQSDFPYGNQWPADVGTLTSQPSAVIKIRWAESIRYNINASGAGHTITVIKK